MKNWNACELAMNVLFLAALFAPFMVGFVRFMLSCVEWRDPVSILGFGAAMAWCAWCVAKVFRIFVQGSIDKTEDAR